MMKKENEIDFVARHYRQGKFSTRAALMRMGFIRARRWTASRIAACAAVILAVTATAAVILRNEFIVHEQVRTAEEAPALPVAPAAVVKSIDFEGASLPTVLNEIKDTYGVVVVGAPENAAQYKLTLHYEGNAEDLISTINEILGLDLKIKE